MKLGKKVEQKSKTNMGLARLPTLQGGYNNDPRIVLELEELKEQNATLKERIKKLEEKVHISTNITIGHRNRKKQGGSYAAKAGRGESFKGTPTFFPHRRAPKP